ncbi:hypothetical protein COCVIDRAFT_30484 [Bipolaris victoriae FI3]|uniref:Terpene synthase n=1 Tax=Bipolaris victoriae (strain FI3) TaxID=930091 RepID=W7DWS5_BIPV3|nr:hypothetical protein COCVIDRAFT_30484 [Bipolaris victoriae FI3]
MEIESLDLIRSFKSMSEKNMENFARYGIMTLTAWAYRRSDADHFRLVSDLMHFFWIIDDFTDNQSLLENESQVANLKRILVDPTYTSSDDGVLENMCRSWWNNVLEILEPPSTTKDLFVRHFICYLDSVVEETQDRETGRLRSRTEHFDIRRRNLGMVPSMDFVCIRFHLSDDMINHEVIQRMTITTTDLIGIANDIYSYNVEQVSGQKSVACNLVDVVLRERGRGVQDTMDVMGKMYRNLFLSLIDDYNHLPTFQDTEQDRVLKEYALGMLDRVEANVEFSLGSQRYFGLEAGLERTRVERMVKLLPHRGYVTV